MPPEPTPDEIARGWQGPNQPRYPKRDLMANTVVPQGTKIYSLQYVDNYGHLVGGDYFFTEDEFKRYLADVKEGRPDAYRRLNERLQIGPKLDYDNNLYQYKPHLVEYEVKYPFRASQGVSTENKQFGGGGGEQLFIHGARTLEGYGTFEKTGRVITPKPNEVVALNTSNLKKFDKNAKKIEPKPPEGRLLVNEYSTLSAAEVADIKLTPNHLHVTEGTRLKPGDPGIVGYGPIKHFPEILTNQPPEILAKTKVGTLPVDKTPSQRSVDVEAAMASASHSNSMPNSVDQATFDHVPQTPIHSSDSSINNSVDPEVTNNKTQPQPQHSSNATEPTFHTVDKTHVVVGRANQASQGAVVATQALTGDVEGAAITGATIAGQQALHKGTETLAEKLGNVVKDKIAKPLIKKIPLGVGAALGAYQVNQAYEEVDRLKEELAKLDPMTPEYKKTQIALSRAERSAELGVASTTTGVFPGIGTATALKIDTVDAALTTKDILFDYFSEKIEGQLEKLTPGTPEYKDCIELKDWLKKADKVAEAIIIGKPISQVTAELFVKETPPAQKPIKENMSKDSFVREADKRAANVGKVFQGILDKLETIDFPQREEKEEKERRILKR